LDAVALREAGLQPATEIEEGAPNRKSHAGLEGEWQLRFLESLGLVCIPCRPAPLLTTRRQWDAWKTAMDPAVSVFSSVESAVSDAIAHGHDPSGRFRTSAEWLGDWDAEYDTQRARENDAWNARSVLPFPFASLPHPESWTEWEPVSGWPSDETLVVVRQETLRG